MSKRGQPQPPRQAGAPDAGPPRPPRQKGARAKTKQQDGVAFTTPALARLCCDLGYVPQQARRADYIAALHEHGYFGGS